MGSFDGLAAFSTYEDDPHKASRPLIKPVMVWSHQEEQLHL